MFFAFHNALEIARRLRSLVARLDRYRIAAGGCAEVDVDVDVDVRAALALTGAWGGLRADEVGPCEALLDREAALLHDLTNPRT